MILLIAMLNGRTPQPMSIKNVLTISVWGNRLITDIGSILWVPNLINYNIDYLSDFVNLEGEVMSYKELCVKTLFFKFIFYYYLTLILLRFLQQHYCYNVTGQSQEFEGSFKPARIKEIHSKLHSF